MFIIERRTAGVLVALATAAAMVVLASVRDRLDVIESPTAANSSVEPGVTPVAFAANQAQSAREIPDIPQSK